MLIKCVLCKYLEPFTKFFGEFTKFFIESKVIYSFLWQLSSPVVRQINGTRAKTNVWRANALNTSRGNCSKSANFPIGYDRAFLIRVNRLDSCLFMWFFPFFAVMQILLALFVCINLFRCLLCTWSCVKHKLQVYAYVRAQIIIWRYNQ